MNRATTIVLVVIALAAGALAGELLSKTRAAHKLAGWIFGRGDLVALFHHRGIFDRERIADEVLRVSASQRRLKKSELDRAMFALRGQFDGDQNFSAAMRANGIWRWQLRGMVVDVFRGEGWMEEKVALQTRVSSDEAKRYFEQHQADFSQPVRLRPRHIFLAAPQGSEIIEAKQVAMQEIIVRLQGGEDFGSLAAAVSEDEASKWRGGDLGFLASERVPAEFWNAIENLPVNGTPAMVQSHLGFHAVQILEVRPPRVMTFAEARPEIGQLLAGEKRRVAVERIREQLRQEALLVSR